MKNYVDETKKITSQIYPYLKNEINNYPEYNEQYFNLIAKSYQDLATSETLDWTKFLDNLLNDANFNLQRNWIDAFLTRYRDSLPNDLKKFCDLSTSIYEIIMDKYLPRDDSGLKKDELDSISMDYASKVYELFVRSVRCELRGI